MIGSDVCIAGTGKEGNNRLDDRTGPDALSLTRSGRVTVHFAILWLAIMLLSGCATTEDYPIAITDQKRQIVAGTRVINRIPQEGFDYQVERSNTAQYAGGGLIPALIDAAVEKYRYARSGRAARFLEQKLAEYDFDSRLNGALKDCLGSIDWLHVSDVQLEKSKDKNVPLDAIQDGENAVMTIDTHYYLDEDLDKLVIKTKAELYIVETTTAQSSNSEPAFRSELFFSRSIPGSSAEEAVKAWSEDEGKAFIQALNEGTDSVCKTLVDYLGQEPGQMDMAER